MPADEMTRKMLSIVRQRQEAQKNTMRIREKLNEEANSDNRMDGIPVTDDAKFGDKTLTNQKESFRKIIKSNVVYADDPLIYYPNDRDLVFAGVITDMQNLKFQFRSNDPSGDGCYIWVDGLALSDDNLKKINLIRNYYTDWRNKLISNPIF